MTDNNPAEPPPAAAAAPIAVPRGWLQGLAVALAVSLGLNLALGGFMVGRSLAFAPRPGPAGAAAEAGTMEETTDSAAAKTTRRGSLGRGGAHAGLRHLLARLPAEDGPRLRRALLARRGDLAAALRDQSRASRRLHRALSAESVEPQAVGRHLAAIRRAQNRMSATAHEALLDALPELSPEGRRDLAHLPRLMRLSEMDGRRPAAGDRPAADGTSGP